MAWTSQTCENYITGQAQKLLKEDDWLHYNEILSNKRKNNIRVLIKKNIIIIIMIILYNKKITIELNSKKKGERKISGLYWIYKY